MEERPLIELVTVFHRDTCHREVHQRTFVQPVPKRVLTRAMSKWAKHIVTFNEEQDEDILVEDRPQIERDTVFLRDTCHREVHQRNIRDKRLPREACFDQGDVKVEKDIVPFNEEEDEGTLEEEGPQIERGTVFLRHTCRSRNIRDKRLPREACVGLGDVKVEMKRRMKTFSWRKDLKLNASQCFSGVAQGHMPP